MLSGPQQSPLSGSAPKQLIVFLHGVGANGDDLFGLVPLIAPAFPEAHFASPNAPYAFDMAPYGYQWFSLRDYSQAALDQGVETAAPHLNAYLDALLEQTGLTEDRLVVVGFSQGTMTALYTLPRRPKACAGVVGFSGALLAADSLTSEVRSRPPVCLIHGQEDTVVPFAAMGMAENILKAGGFAVEAHARPGLPHGIDPEGIEIAKRFISRCLA